MEVTNYLQLHERLIILSKNYSNTITIILLNNKKLRVHIKECHLSNDGGWIETYVDDINDITTYHYDEIVDLK